MKTTTATKKPSAKATAVKKTTASGKVKPKRTAAEILEETLKEEKNADSTLTHAAYNYINFQTEQAGEE